MLAEISRFPSPGEAQELCLILHAEGIAARFEVIVVNNGRQQRLWAVSVPSDQAAQALQIIAEERQQAPRPSPTPKTRSQAPLYWVAALIVINVCIWFVLEGNGGSEDTRTLIRFGASHAPRLLDGQWWRLLSATFLHIGLLHLLGNMISLAIFGGFALRQWGVARFYLVYLATGVGGNLVSLMLAPTLAVKAGASGSILGLLGALAGSRIRGLRQNPESSRYKTWHVVAMLVAYYGFTLGTGRTDHGAHLGGMFCGVVLALLLKL